MALAARFENPRTQLAACLWVRRLWVLLVAVNLAGAVHEAVTGDWMAPLNLAAAGLVVAAYRGFLRPMLTDARRAHIAELEQDLGMR